MSDLLLALPLRVLHAAVVVALLGVAVWLVLRVVKVRSPAIHRFAWLLVLVQGLVLWRLPIDLALLSPARMSVAAAPASAGPDASSWETAREFDRRSQTADSHFASDRPRQEPLWLQLVALLWLGGAVGLAVRMGWSYFNFVRRLPTSLPAAPQWIAELDQCRKEQNVRRPVILLVTTTLGPALCWLPQGHCLIVPGQQWGCLTQLQRLGVLRHELAHYRRGDLWKSLLARFLLLPQWFNPCAWWAVWRFEESAEWACDDVVRAASEDTFSYARALLELGQPSGRVTSLHAAVRGGSLPTRIRRLLSPPRKDSIMNRTGVIVVAFGLTLAGLVQWRLVAATPPVSAQVASAAAGGVERDTQKEKTPEPAPVEAPAPKGAESPSSGAGQEAVLDMSRTFKEFSTFSRRTEVIRAKAVASEQECKQRHDVIRALQQRQQATDDAEFKVRLEREMAMLISELEAKKQELQRQLRQDEVTAYHEAYEQIRAVVAEVAKQRGIRLVRQAKSVATETVDPKDPAAILERINRDIIYSDPQQLDITDEVVARLNRGATTR